MKSLLNQHLLWIGMSFLLLSMALAVGHSVIAPGRNGTDRYSAFLG